MFGIYQRLITMYYTFTSIKGIKQHLLTSIHDIVEVRLYRMYQTISG